MTRPLLRKFPGTLPKEMSVRAHEMIEYTLRFAQVVPGFQDTVMLRDYTINLLHQESVVNVLGGVIWTGHCSGRDEDNRVREMRTRPSDSMVLIT